MCLLEPSWGPSWGRSLTPPSLPRASPQQPRLWERLGGSTLGTEPCLLLPLLLFGDKYQEAHKRGSDRFLLRTRNACLKVLLLWGLAACCAGLRAPRAASACFTLQCFRDCLLSLETCVRQDPFGSQKNGNQKKQAGSLSFTWHTCRNSLCCANPRGSRRALHLHSPQGKGSGPSAHLC